MAGGDGLPFVRLVDEDGRDVADPFQRTRKLVIGISVDTDFHELAKLQVAHLGFLDVRFDPNLVGVVQQQQPLTRLQKFAR